ncbi:hypothetical protein NCS55_01268900 [Fusarium keratoplasticum]|nr:hypothetical protein NCS55_01268900 [Fusarium keratoplasticum]
MAEDISDWLLQSDTEPYIAFGYAQYLSNVPSNATVWNHLLERVVPTEPVLVVAPPYEIPEVAFSYEEFLDFVKRERRGAGRGPEVWPKVSGLDRLIVMVAVEPHIPADCALSLAMVVHWASDRPSGLSMRVLTVSTSHDCPEMAALVTSKSMPEPKQFLLDITRQQGAPRVKSDIGEESDVEERVKSNVARQDGSQVVVLFASDGPSKHLAISLRAQGWPITSIHRRTPSYSMQLASTTSEEHMCRVLHVQDPIRSPFPLTGFDHVHVVTNSTSTKVVFDAVTGQLTSTLAQTSKHERKEQLAYAYRSQGASSVSVYVDRPAASFLQAGTRLRRLQAVLPILDYDHRLAYFVAQHTDTTILRQSKLQLASLLAVGVLKVINLPAEMRDALDALALNCWGYTRPLAKQGAIWMALGLWKLAAKQFHDFHEAVSDLTHVPVFGTPLHVSLKESTKVVHTINRLASALKKPHIGLIDLPTADETGELDEAGCLELQTHLFTAFLGQLIAGSPSDGEWYREAVASGTRVVAFQNWVHSFANIDQVHQANGQTVVWGVFNTLLREDRRAWASDWTWIPGSIVAEYWDRRGADVNLFTLLSGQARPLWNSDEVSE